MRLPTYDTKWAVICVDYFYKSYLIIRLHIYIGVYTQRHDISNKL